MNEPVITNVDLRKAGLCARGVRAWFQAHPQLDYGKFLREGLPCSVVASQGDALSDRMVRIVRARNEGESWL